MTNTSPAWTLTESQPSIGVTRPSGVLDPVPAERARLAAGQAEGGDAAVAGERGHGHRLTEAEPADAAVAAAPAARAAAARPDPVRLEQHRVAPLQHLGVGEPGVGHLGLHHVGAVEAVARARPAGHRLVVLVPVVAERHVVHRPRPLGHHAEGGVERPGDDLGGLHVARRHRGRVLRREHRARRDDHVQRVQAARVERDVVVDQGAEHVQHGRHGHAGRRVEVAGQLRRGPGEVDLGGPVLPVDPDGHPDHRAVVEFVAELAVVQRGDDPPDGLGRVLLHVPHVGVHHVQAEVLPPSCAARRCPSRSPRSGRAGRRGWWPGSRDGYSAVVQQLDGLGFPQPPVLDQQPVVDQHPLLLDPGAGGGHGPRRHPADLGVVAAAGHVEPDVVLFRGEDRGDHGDVGQVGAAVVGVVEDIDVAAADPAAVALDHHLDGLAHGAEVHRHVRGVGDQAAVGVEDRAGEVEPLLDVDRVRGGLQAHAHLFGHRHEQVVEDLQHHRVGRVC